MDEDGQPRGGLVLINPVTFPELTPDRGILPGTDSSPGIRIGRDGRFRIEGLVPGLKYGAYAIAGPRSPGDVFRDVTVAPGEVKDLGDLKVIPPGRDN